MPHLHDLEIMNFIKNVNLLPISDFINCFNLVMRSNSEYILYCDYDTSF